MRNNPGRLLAKSDIWRAASQPRTGRVHACSRGVLVVDKGEGTGSEVIWTRFLCISTAV